VELLTLLTLLLELLELAGSTNRGRSGCYSDLAEFNQELEAGSYDVTAEPQALFSRPH
jgi:hypothetical protein